MGGFEKLHLPEGSSYTRREDRDTNGTDELVRKRKGYSGAIRLTLIINASRNHSRGYMFLNGVFESTPPTDVEKCRESPPLWAG
jgi:hypothetical protein